jgi:NADPH2 dehydrogenase
MLIPYKPNPSSSQRTDQYGGSVENRMRFPLKVMQTLASVFPTNRLGIRLSPFSTFQGMRESDPYATFIPWTKLLLQTFPDLAYIHVVESRIAGASDSDSLEEGDDVQVFRGLTKELGGGKVRFLTAGGWDPRTAVEHAKAFPEDLVVFGRYFIGTSCRIAARGNSFVLTLSCAPDQPTPICLKGSNKAIL